MTTDKLMSYMAGHKNFEEHSDKSVECNVWFGGNLKKEYHLNRPSACMQYVLLTKGFCGQIPTYSCEHRRHQVASLGIEHRCGKGHMFRAKQALSMTSKYMYSRAASITDAVLHLSLAGHHSHTHKHRFACLMQKGAKSLAFLEPYNSASTCHCTRRGYAEE